MIAISLGWGVQSFGMAAMVALGDLPPVDVAIHADTTYERAETYAFAETWTPWLESRGVPVVTVRPSANKLLEDNVARQSVRVPAFTTRLDGALGQLQRQCTFDWKVAPIRRYLQARRGRAPVELWLGISLDEVGRVKPSDVGYVTHRWPLIEGDGWRRAAIVDYLVERGLDVPPRSACYFCPYHSRAEWRTIKAGPDWPKTVAVDDALRDARPSFTLYLHRSRLPMADVDLASETERGQLGLWDEECTGSCHL